MGSLDMKLNNATTPLSLTYSLHRFNKAMARAVTDNFGLSANELTYLHYGEANILYGIQCRGKLYRVSPYTLKGDADWIY